MSKLISTWAELEKVPDSETHYLVIGDCNGWIHRKDETEDDFPEYLSTHTFYGSTYQRSTALLQSCGFDIEIDNWDKGESDDK